MPLVQHSESRSISERLSQWAAVLRHDILPNQSSNHNFGFSLNGVIFLVTFWASIASDLRYRGKEWEDEQLSSYSRLPWPGRRRAGKPLPNRRPRRAAPSFRFGPAGGTPSPME